ncbi:phosphatidylglycerol lysyltransferase domain-containing protein [Deferribacter thermophilus]|uniref:phosphatidylglycerol lysyltransferase domain-containing protein n=1 Tax=Deferribacter thermophilus TaxID=53573 RepID=UPI003C24B03B
MNCEQLELSHKNILFNKLKSIDTMISEYNFANLYLFRKKHQYEVCSTDFNNERYFFIKGKTYDNKTYIMPIFEIDENTANLFKELQNDVDYLFPIDEKWLKYFKEHNYYYFDGDSDYIYTVEKISSYSGRKLHKKRNLVKQFKNLYEVEVKALLSNEVKNAKKILEEWVDENTLSKNETDFFECLEALDLLEELVLCGLIYYVNGKPAGFIIGEEHNQDLFLIHFAKGLKKYKGIYQFIYNDFAKKLPKKYK